MISPPYSTENFLRFLQILDCLHKYKGKAKQLREENYIVEQQKEFIHNPVQETNESIEKLAVSLFCGDHCGKTTLDQFVKEGVKNSIDHIRSTVSTAIKLAQGYCTFLKIKYSANGKEIIRLSNTITELEDLQKNLTHECNIKVIKSVIIKRLLSLMKDTTKIRQTISYLELHKIYCLQVIMESLIEMVENLSELVDDEAVTGLKLEFKKQLLKIMEKIEKCKELYPAVTAGVSALITGVGTAIYCIATCATIGSTLLAVGGTFIAGGIVGCGLGHLYTLVCENSGKLEAKTDYT